MLVLCCYILVLYYFCKRGCGRGVAPTQPLSLSSLRSHILCISSILIIFYAIISSFVSIYKALNLKFIQESGGKFIKATIEYKDICNTTSILGHDTWSFPFCHSQKVFLLSRPTSRRKSSVILSSKQQKSSSCKLWKTPNRVYLFVIHHISIM